MREKLARAIHEARIKCCYGEVGKKDPWEKPNPASPNQPWHDIAYAQADAVLRMLKDD